MDMDMDVNWCLTCSKRTLDTRNPYCSEACRQADLQSTTLAAAATAPLKSPAPVPAFVNPFSPAPIASKTGSSSGGRPPLAPLVPPLIVAPVNEAAPRDRRAFSFPAEQMFDTPPRRRDSMAMPAFARKPKITHHPTTTNATPILGASLRAPNGDKLSKSSGAITPLAHDSVFCSTSESSDNEGAAQRTKAKLNMSSTVRPTAITRTSRSGRPSLPAEFSKSAGASLRAPSYLMSKEYADRKKSQSPVSPIAGVVASSSSSRSREDIMSWARAVKSRPGDAPDTSEDEFRGRSRTRREGTTETVREVVEEENLATTPKGRIESVLGGLTIGRFGVGPIVKALTSVTGSTTAAARPPFEHKRTDSSAYTSAPAPAEVSKVAVVSSTAIAAGSSGYALEENQIFFGGATPTLSTVSLSEVNEPQSIVTDPMDHEHDHSEVMLHDDQSMSAASSSRLPHRRRSGPPARETLVKGKQQATPRAQPNQSSVSPLRPIQSTASVIWNLSSYLRSFTPFTLPQPSPSRTPHEASPHKETPSTEISEPTSMSITSPLPTSRMPSRAPSPARELVRSLPMNIIAPSVSSANTNPDFDDRARHLEAQEYIDAMEARRSRSRHSRSKRQSRSRGRSNSRRPIELESAHARKWSYDADQSGTEDEVEVDAPPQLNERRGRSPQAKALVGEEQHAVKVELFSQQPPAERSWSPRRDADTRASRSRGRRESPRGRGRDRDRTVRGV